MWAVPAHAAYVDPCLEWRTLSPNQAGAGLPEPRHEHSILYDAPRQRLLLFGGVGASDYGNNDVWAYDLAGATGWMLITPTGLTPPRRRGQTAILDAANDRMLVFGGFAPDSGRDIADVWALSLSGSPAWTELHPTGTHPLGRERHSAVYDAVHARMLVFGGYSDYIVDNLADTWALSLGGSPAWAALSPTGTPGPREDHAAIDDPVRDRMLVFAQGETWALSLSGPGSPAWTNLAPTGSVPASASAAYDATHDRALLTDSYGLFTLDLVAPAWTPIPTSSPPTFRGGAPLIYDAANDRPVLQGGCCELNDVVTLEPSGEARLLASVSPATPGSVTRSPDSTCFAPGSTVTLTAVGTDLWGFTGWSGDASGTANPLDVVMGSSPKNIVAHFATTVLTVTVDPGTNAGSVEISPPGQQYRPGTVVTLTARPAAGTGWAFESWGGDASGSDNPLTVTMDASKTIVAHFVYWNYTLATSVFPAGQGSVAISPIQATYRSGQPVVLTATPSNGATFLNWSGDASGSINPLTVTMTGSKTIVANFSGYTLTTTVSPAGAGAITRSPDLPAYAPGTVVTLTPNPIPGARFVDWGGALSGSVSPATITMDWNKAVTANFSILTATVSPPGSGKILSNFVALGATAQLTAAPNRGFQFLNWSGALSGSENPTPLVMDAPKTVTAYFTAEAAPLPTIFSPTPTVSTGLAGYSLRLVRLNADALPDVVGHSFMCTGTGHCESDELLMFTGTGAGAFITNGTLQEVPPTDGGTYGGTLATGDFTGDGIDDVAFWGNTYLNTPYLATYRGNGSGGLITPPIYSMVGAGYPSKMLARDFNHDNKLDLLVGVQVYLGDGNGGFTPGLQVLPSGPNFATGDLDRDGNPDLATPVPASNTVGVMMGNGDGTFDAPVTYATGTSPIAVAEADIDGDSFLDLITANNGNYSVSVLRGNGDGTFAAKQDVPVADVPTAVTAADLDNDTRGDIVCAGLSFVTVLHNRGGGTYDREEYAPVTTSRRLGGPDYYLDDLTIADLDGDARPDVFVVNQPHSNHTYDSAEMNALHNKTGDDATPSLIAEFAAATRTEGIEVRWRLMDPSRVRSVSVERATATEGPWSVAPVERREDAGLGLALDRGVEPGREYFYRLRATLADGGVTLFGPVSSQGERIAESAISRLVPNPSAGDTRVDFAVARAGRIRLEVLDVAGRVAALLTDGARKPGRYSVSWSVVGSHGRAAPGLYFVRLTAPDRTVVRKLAMTR